MDDNSRPHSANLVEDSLFDEGIVRMEWPTCSPDMDLIEHVWDALGRRVAGRQPSPKLSKNWKELFWKSGTEYPQLVINSLINSMPQRDGLYRYKNKVKAIFSTHCLCSVENQRAAFQNIYELLEDGGRAALLFFRKSMYKDFLVMLRNDPILQPFINSYPFIPMLADKLEAFDNIRSFLPSGPRRHVKASETVNDERRVSSRKPDCLPKREYSHPVPNERSPLRCYG
ncbi:transposable element Tcb2 transposase [Trichonephila clavipes]|nr:transposable element Tcb2 transposase [Trichonephila clavipes]